MSWKIENWRVALHSATNRATALRDHHLLDPARGRIDAQGVIDGALVGLRERRLAHMQRAAVIAAKAAGHSLLADENAAQRLP